MRAVLAIFVMLASCNKPDAQRAAPADASVPATPSASASATTRAAPRETHAAAAKTEAIVHAWNAAINAHDAAALGALYADSIDLYGETVARDRAVAMKKAAFAWHVRDDLGAIAVSDSGRATFHKKSVQKGGKVIDVLGYLDVQGGKIVAEGDATTDKNLARARAVGCEDNVLALVEATPEAKSATADIETGAKTSPEPVSVAGMVLPPEGDRRDWSVSVCENHPDRMVCLHHFLVDPATAKITYELGDTRTLAGDPALAAKVRAACR